MARDYDAESNQANNLQPNQQRILLHQVVEEGIRQAKQSANQGLLVGKQAECVIADKGYDSDALIALIEQQGAQAVIPSRANRKQLREYDRHRYKERHLIECFFSKLKQYRRVFSRFDKLARNYWSFVCFACSLIWLR